MKRNSLAQVLNTKGFEPTECHGNLTTGETKVNNWTPLLKAILVHLQEILIGDFQPLKFQRSSSNFFKVL